MSYFDGIKADLLNVPDDAVKVWLAPLADGGYGWPPPKSDGGKWRCALLNKTLDYWQKTTWLRIEHPLDWRSISLGSRHSINGLIEAHISNVQNEYSKIYNSAARFQNISTHMRLHGVLPQPAAMMQTFSGLEIIDGNHRLAALVALRLLWERMPEKMVEANIAKPADKQPILLVTPPAEGTYEIDELTAYYEEWARGFGEEAPSPKRTFRLPHPNDSER